jgi:putative ABC transport system permease protein
MSRAQIIAQSLKGLFRQAHHPSIRLLFLSLVMSVLSITTIMLVSDMLKRSLTNSATQFIAGDRQLVSPKALNAEWLVYAEQLGLQHAKSLEFSSMLYANDQFQLVSVKAVDQKYPLKGELLIEGKAGERVSANKGPEQTRVWMHKRLFSLFDISAGDTVSIGDMDFVVSHELAQEPDAGFQLAALAPRVLMRSDDVGKTGVIQPGSRVTWRYYFVGSETSIVLYEKWLLPKLDPSQKWQGVKEGRPAIQDALEKTETYLLLGGSLAVLLACIAVAMASRQFALGQIDSVAIMKTLGVRSSKIIAHFIIQLLFLGVLASVIGLVLGAISAFFLQGLLSALMPELQWSIWSIQSAKVLFIALGTVFISLIGFALPQFFQLRKVSPMRVLRQEKMNAMAWSWQAALIAIVAIFALLYGYSQNVTLVVGLLVSVLSLFVVLIFCSWLLYQVLGRKIIQYLKVGSILRQAILNLLRRPWHTLIQLGVFSMTLLLFCIIFIARESLVDNWQGQLPENTPNHFLINVSPSDLSALEQTLKAQNIVTNGLYPMVRGRLSHINDVPVKVAVTKDVAALNRELNLTWSRTLPDDNRIIEGAWWDKKRKDPNNLLDKASPLEESLRGEEQVNVSVEEKLAGKLGLALGDFLQFSIGGEALTAQVSSIRSVQWDSMRPNFYMMFDEGKLGNFPSTYITSFHITKEQKSLLNILGKQFPTVSILELDQLVDKLRIIIHQVSQMVEMILVFTVLAALLVISALINTTMGERAREAALMRTFGVKARFISLVQCVEFGLLGWVAAWLGLMCAEAVMWVVQIRLFDFAYQPHYLLWLYLPIISMMVIGFVSYLHIRHVPRTSPMEILRHYS